MNAFKGKRRILWLGGITVLVLGLMAAFVVLPAVSPTPGAGSPQVDVPKMQNVPADEAAKVRLDVEDER